MGYTAIDLWDNVIEVPRAIKGDNQPNLTSLRKLGAAQSNGTVCNSKTKTDDVKNKEKVDQEFNVDHVHSNRYSAQGEAQLYIFEDN